MTNVHIKLAQDHEDKRSDEIELRVEVINDSSEPVEMLSLTPRIPDGVQINEVKSSTQELAKEKQQRICQELEEILRSHMLLISSEYKQKIIDAEVEILRETLKELQTIWRIYLSMFTGKLGKNIQQRIEKRKSYVIQINDLKDAKIAYAKWIEPLAVDNSIKILYETKLTQLENIE